MESESLDNSLIICVENVAENSCTKWTHVQSELLYKVNSCTNY